MSELLTVIKNISDAYDALLLLMAKVIGGAGFILLLWKATFQGRGGDEK